MKKLILMASAALAFGGVAYAQDASQPPAGTTAPDASAQPPAGAGDPSMPTTGGTATTPDASGGMTPPPTGATDPNAGMAPGGAAPAPGTATGPNGPVSTTPTQGPTDLPMCSKTVTDNCKQGSGGGYGKSGGHHRAMHHKKK